MRISKSLLAALLLPAAAAAQPIDYQPAPQGPVESGPPMASGAYVGLRGSYAMNANSTSAYAMTAPPTALRASYASGGGGSVFIGAHLPLNLRLELEALYRWQPLSRLSLNGAPVAANGSERIAAPMLNLLWDVPMTGDMEMAIQPFVGLGVGAAYHETLADDGAGGNGYLHSTKWNLAYSFMGGLAVPVADNTRLTAMYRWMQIRDVGYRCAVSGPAKTGVCSDTNANSSSVDLGLEMDL